METNKEQQPKHTPAPWADLTFEDKVFEKNVYKNAQNYAERYSSNFPPELPHEERVSKFGSVYIAFAAGAKYGIINNPYKTACESINPDNPMAVAENLKMLFYEAKAAMDSVDEIDNFYFTSGTVMRWKNLLTKMQAK